MQARARRDMTLREFKAALINQEFKSVPGIFPYFQSTRGGTSPDIHWSATMRPDWSILRRETIKKLIAARNKHEAGAE